MAIFKCKMCGGSLDIVEGSTVCECEYCGTKQTVPRVLDESMQNLFNRANTLRMKGEFDKAEAIYEKIISVDSKQSEGYWGLILCKYGIEYVDDPNTFEKIPTCHRASYESIIADEDYKSALANADIMQRSVYEEQAKEIDRIQKEILALAQKEETYDVFICYKETDASGQRTQDSVIANDIYYQLTNEGFKVFYAAITLEGKLGSAYEPIIFAALNSAKVMLVIGTNPEYFNAVWVKNEWSRYLKIIQKDRSKLLIPCYRDMDAYELPEEFAHLQAQDMSKIGFINDVVRGIKKVVAKDEKTNAVEPPKVQMNSSDALIKRIYLLLEDGEFDKANELCEQVLNGDPENAEAYICALLIEFKCHTKDELLTLKQTITNSKNYAKVIRFGNDEQIAYVKGTEDSIQTYFKKVREEEERKIEEQIRLDEERKLGEKRKKEELKRKLSLVTVGQYIEFGSYEQDNASNGKEPIEWKVLAVKGGKALLISKYALDCKPYNISGSSVTWETCSLRKWLNYDFMNSAFSENEKSMISITTIPADKNSPYSFSYLYSKETRDKIFLLSVDEAKKYFSSNFERQCKPTKYAVANKVYTNNENCWWWLRSLRTDTRTNTYNRAVGVDSIGGIFNLGSSINSDDRAVRPALWIQL